MIELNEFAVKATNNAGQEISLTIYAENYLDAELKGKNKLEKEFPDYDFQYVNNVTKLNENWD